MSVVQEESKKTLIRPWRVLRIFSGSSRRLFYGHLLARVKSPQTWANEGAGFIRRSYNTYEEYLDHQISTLEELDLSEYDVQFHQSLRTRLCSIDLLRIGMSVLCLAARAGSEVKAFLDLGCFAVGIDINNRSKNRYVLYGDFHDLQFSSGSVDVVYTNSLDHAFDIRRIIGEIKRVLKPEGILIIEASKGTGKQLLPGVYEAFWWEGVNDLALLFERNGFVLTNHSEFEKPWPGEMLCFRNRKVSELE